jgi:hypothetical protein
MEVRQDRLEAALATGLNSTNSRIDRIADDMILGKHEARIDNLEKK